jgi:hypothetical protein
LVGLPHVLIRLDFLQICYFVSQVDCLFGFKQLAFVILILDMALPKNLNSKKGNTLACWLLLHLECPTQYQNAQSNQKS